MKAHVFASKWWIGAALALVALAAGTSNASADEDDDDESTWYDGTEVTETAAKETWAHVFAVRKSWSLSNGTTWAPATNLQQDGIRLRLVSSLQGYRYTTRQYSPATGDAVNVEHAGYGRSNDLLLGYQWSVAAWTLKAFAGYHLSATVGTRDPEVRRKLAGDGVRGVFEAWYAPSDKAWAALDLSYVTLNRAYAARARAAWSPLQHWAGGPEAHAIGSVDGHSQRLGAFVRFDNGWHEVSVAAGYEWVSGQDTAPYASLQYMRRF